MTAMTLRTRRLLLLATVVVVLVGSALSLIVGDGRSDIALLAADLAVVLVGGLWLRQPGATGAARSASVGVTPSQLSDYVAVLAHELKSPIVSIGASAQLLAKELEGRDAGAKARGIADEARQMFALLESLLDLSALESGRLRLSLRSVDIGALVAGCAALIEPSGPRLVIDVPAEPVVVTGDDRRLRQVLGNLVDNAAKYSAPGTQIEIRVGVTSDHRSAIVQVRDHGAGIPPPERGRLFDKFVRLSTAGSTRGSGLGLYLCKAIIEDHGGEIWAEFPAAGGTVIDFTVPRTITRRPVPGEANVANVP
jgi:signal transduction histidine kinase